MMSNRCHTQSELFQYSVGMDHQFTRTLNLSGASNFRDIGGYRGHEGRQVRWRRIFRSDHLAALTVPGEDYFIWLTGEGKVVKTLSRQFETDAIDPQLVRASAYWHAK